jgi:RNase P/RNase MRP subunit p30
MLDLTFNYCPVSGVASKLNVKAFVVAGFFKKDLPKSSDFAFYSCCVFSKPDFSGLRKARLLSDFVAVDGCSPELCAWAANSKVDLLLQPFGVEGNFVDSETAGVLARNNVFVGILFSEFLKLNGYQRQLLLKNAVQCIKVLENSGVKLVFFSGAENEFQLRSPRDFSSFGVLLGLKRESALKCVKQNLDLFLGRLHEGSKSE